MLRELGAADEPLPEDLSELAAHTSADDVSDVDGSWWRFYSAAVTTPVIATEYRDALGRVPATIVKT